jgi:S-adenosylmethionine hydrolase
VRGEIVYIDRFGNGITNINRAHLATLESEKLVITVRRRRLKLRRFYQEVRSGWPLALIGSTGFLEIAVHGNSAAKRLRLWIGLFVEARPVPARRAALPSAAAQPVPLAQTD